MSRLTLFVLLGMVVVLLTLDVDAKKEWESEVSNLLDAKDGQGGNVEVREQSLEDEDEELVGEEEFEVDDENEDKAYDDKAYGDEEAEGEEESEEFDNK